MFSQALRGVSGPTSIDKQIATTIAKLISMEIGWAALANVVFSCSGAGSLVYNLFCVLRGASTVEELYSILELFHVGEPALVRVNGQG
jgi:hypothetical protein